MLARENARTENVRWEVTQLPNRLPDEWRKWKSNNLSRMARVRRLSRVQGTDAFTPLRGLIVLTSWEQFSPGEQFILMISPANAGSAKEFLCEVTFARRSPLDTWTVGTRVLASVGVSAMEQSGRFAA